MDKKALESKLKRLRSKQKKLADPSRLDGKISDIEKLLGGTSGKRKRKNNAGNEVANETGQESKEAEGEGPQCPENAIRG